MTRANQISGRAYLTNGRAIGGSAIPDSVLSLLDFENSNNDTSVAKDIQGSNDGNINGASYNSDAAVGSQAIKCDQSNSTQTVASESSVDLVSNGSEEAMGIAGWIKPTTTTSNDFEQPITWGSDASNLVYLTRRGSTWSFRARLGGTTFVDIDTSIDATVNSYNHFVAYVTQSEGGVYINNNSPITQSHSKDITNYGSYKFYVADALGRGKDFNGLVDDQAVFDVKPTASDVDILYNR